MTDPIIQTAETDAKGFWTLHKASILIGIGCFILGLIAGHVL